MSKNHQDIIVIPPLTMFLWTVTSPFGTFKTCAKFQLTSTTRENIGVIVYEGHG